MRPTQKADQSREAVDALVTDQYLDAILAQAERRESRTSARTADGALAPRGRDRHGAVGVGAVQPGVAAPDLESVDPDAAVLHAGAVLRATLLRAHPSFRFEERLAAQLAELAEGRSWRAVANAGRPSDVIPFPVAPSPADDPLLAAVLAGQLDPSDETAVDRANGLRSPARPLLVGGAITSAAISLVGVAWVAWRASHSGGAPMARAARAAHTRRHPDLADLAVGIPGGPA